VRKWIVILATTSVALGGLAIGKDIADGIGLQWAQVRARWVTAGARRPPRKLAIRSHDYQRYPREAFGFVLEDHWGNRVDTFAGTITRDLIADRDTTITMRLSNAEMDAIYEKAIEIRLFEFPGRLPDRISGSMYPARRIRLVARAGDARQSLVWDTGGLVEGVPSDDWKRRRDLIRLIEGTVRAREEYRALPPPRGNRL
jgi:hypothetical protein